VGWRRCKEEKEEMCDGDGNLMGVDDGRGDQMGLLVNRAWG
jgi:hypothetical protein